MENLLGEKYWKTGIFHLFQQGFNSQWKTPIDPVKCCASCTTVSFTYFSHRQKSISTMYNKQGCDDFQGCEIIRWIQEGPHLSVLYVVEDWSTLPGRYPIVQPVIMTMTGTGWPHWLFPFVDMIYAEIRSPWVRNPLCHPWWMNTCTLESNLSFPEQEGLRWHTFRTGVMHRIA